MRRRDSLHYALLSLFFDNAVIVIALILAVYMYPLITAVVNPPSYVEVLPISILAIMSWLVIGNLVSVYNPYRNYRAIDEFQRIIVGSFLSLLMLVGALFFTRTQTPRLFILIFYIAHILLLFGWRGIARILFRMSHNDRYRRSNVLVVGANGIGKQVVDAFFDNTWMGLNVVGFIDDDEDSLAPNIPVIAPISDIFKVIEQHQIDEVVITLPPKHPKFDQLIAKVHTLPIQVYIIPNYVSLALKHAQVEEFGGLPLINLRAPALNQYQRMVKRLFDVVGSALLLLVLSPLFVVIAVAIKRDSPGSALFKQTRAGENSKHFTMYKFRTMYVDAEDRLNQVIKTNPDGSVTYKTKDDPRVTRVGRFLRRTSLDELPQLFNVLRGDMSLVGPRPELPWLIENYELWQFQRFSVPQGMTGWWQINGRSDKPMHLHTEDDLYYIQNYSLLLDIYIIWQTIGVVLKGKGAY